MGFYFDVWETEFALNELDMGTVWQFLMGKHRNVNSTNLLVLFNLYLDKIYNIIKDWLLLIDRSSFTGNCGSYEVQWNILKFRL